MFLGNQWLTFLWNSTQKLWTTILSPLLKRMFKFKKLLSHDQWVLPENFGFGRNSIPDQEITYKNPYCPTKIEWENFNSSWFTGQECILHKHCNPSSTHCITDWIKRAKVYCSPEFFSLRTVNHSLFNRETKQQMI